MEILIIEDEPSTRALLTQMLTTRGHRCTACASAEQGVEAYRQSFYPLVLLDLFLPGMSGFEFCRWLREQRDGDRPYVLIGTASREPRDLRQILDHGADDYLSKPYAAELLDVRLAVAEQGLKVRAARRQAEEELHLEREQLAYLAMRDPLTKLHNRAYFSDAVGSAVAAAGAGGPPGALFYLDLDNFKLINDSLGHAAGDRLLVQIAYLLRNAVRGNDTLARFGGDKFIVLQEEVTVVEARLMAERLRGRISDFVFCDSGRTFHLGVSIGVAGFTGEASAEHTVAAADAACYAAKARGRNRGEVYHPDDCELTQLRTDANRATQIKHALKANSFEMQFQPVVAIETGQVLFHEARLLLRTDAGERLEPAAFLPTAERFHLEPEIDRLTVHLASRHLAANPELRLAIPLSGRSFADAGLPDYIHRAVTGAGVNQERVTFELDEPAVIANLDAAHALTERLRKESFRFALDDFGAGFSSFTYLDGLAVDFLKIDSRFIGDLMVEPINLAFVKMMNDIARHLRIYSVAEHVDGVDTIKALRGIGVRCAQGRYFNPSSSGSLVS